MKVSGKWPSIPKYSHIALTCKAYHSPWTVDSPFCNVGTLSSVPWVQEVGLEKLGLALAVGFDSFLVR